MIEVNKKYLSKRFQNENVRWFTDNSHDLFLWFNHREDVHRIQFTYGKNSPTEHMLEWSEQAGLSSFLVDDGEQTVNSRFKSTPIIASDNSADIRPISLILSKLASKLDSSIYKIIYEKLSKY